MSRLTNLVDCITRAMTRRAATGGLVGLALGSHASPAVTKRKKRGGKKAQFCLDGMTVGARSKDKKRRLRKKGAERGRCEACVPTCPPGACGDNGCGGVCACVPGTICVAGACRVCDVGCSGSSEACGVALNAALAIGGDVFVCPGRYTTSTIPGFEIPNDTRVFGAGGGDDPATSTIFDALRRAQFRVISVPSTSANITLSGLRITGGIGRDRTAGGVHSISQGTLGIQNCVITDNLGEEGGGLFHKGVLQMSGTVVSANTASIGNGGGLELQPQLADQVSVISNSIISGNFAHRGGGIFLFTISATQSLQIASSSQVINNRTDNTGPEAGGAILLDGLTALQVGSVVATGATVAGNTEPQCISSGDPIVGC